jgi:dienelactone hydrolase
VDPGPGSSVNAGTTPTIPPIAGDCPAFRAGTISFGGVSGIALDAGAKAAGATAPLIIYWHGTGSFAGEYAGMAAAVHQGAMSEGGALVSFQGSSGVGDSSCSGTFIFSLGDMDVVDGLVACAVQDHNIDPRRIFTTGCSAGGLFAACMAARRSSYIAAVAPNSGGFVFPQPFDSDYTPPLMTMHGAAGVDVVVVDFANTSATADRSFKDRGGFVINCDTGGRHCGAGGLAPDVWEFFKAHPYGVEPNPWEAGLPAGFNSDCAIY